MTETLNDTIALADRIERGLLYLTGDGPLLESEHCLIVAALRANRAVADLEAENQELRVLLADERAAHRVCVEMRDEAERKSPDCGEIERLRERCNAYKGQVEAGSIAIQHLQGEIDRLRGTITQIVDVCDDNADAACNQAMALAFVRSVAADAMSSGSES